ncbi:hypothetical protein BJ138DRAFT_1120807 [Hygrophoropsis aurantiaca]|uniref:Uncharacterized protein n=1 Tax=Hygrophoropsis aurantiaca TaxID=72124 RepID=A0ACB7ZQE4_9AGAM|nr:hypothetical protein BJ138DRAFT_1120807 [Hygrophoropsis aurantiaca]
MPSPYPTYCSSANKAAELGQIDPQADDDLNVEETKSSAFHQDIAATRPAPSVDHSKVEDRDKLLLDTYRGLVPLRSVSLTGAGENGRTVLLSNWPADTGGTFNEKFVVDLISFKTYASYINMSRIDPALLTPKSVGKGLYVSFLLGDTMQLATCVSVIVVVDSFIGEPGRTAWGPKKEITGYFLSQEFERFAGVAGAVFGGATYTTHTFNSAFKFGTFVDPRKSSSIQTSGSTMFSARPSPSSTTSTSPTTRAVLSYDSVVPLYDYRSEHVFDPVIHLNPHMYGKALPSHRDLPKDSLALVAYTTTNFTLRGEPAVGCNIMWAALLAAPKNAKLPDPPSMLEQSPTKAAVARKKAGRKN